MWAEHGWIQQLLFSFLPRETFSLLLLRPPLGLSLFLVQPKHSLCFGGVALKQKLVDAALEQFCALPLPCGLDLGLSCLCGELGDLM